jgi:ubiquinol-cytochrome c reductase iron-sulfur subunit
MNRAAIAGKFGP